jgi:hypothetical protein
MRVEHLAIDGSLVSVEAEAELNTGSTAAGWAIVPSLFRSHPFSIYAAGHSAIVERAARAVRELKVLGQQEFSVKNGKLRTAEIDLPTATGGRRQLTVGAWEGRAGCLTTSLVGQVTNRLVEVFDTLQFTERRGGLAIDSPVLAVPRVPEVVKEIPGLGVLSIRPAVSSELDRLPKSRGFQTISGELFRSKADRRGLLFVSRSVVALINPPPGVDPEVTLRIANGLRVEWAPRKSLTIQ